MFLFTRVKVASGFSSDMSAPGGVVLLVYDQSYRPCFSKYNNVVQNGLWMEYGFSLKECVADAGSTADLKHITSYGLRFETNAGTPTSPKPTEAHIFVDTIGYKVSP
jgi:hypothetical protein